jgi:hypothetical protein
MKSTLAPLLRPFPIRKGVPTNCRCTYDDQGFLALSAPRPSFPRLGRPLGYLHEGGSRQQQCFDRRNNAVRSWRTIAWASHAGSARPQHGEPAASDHRHTRRLRTELLLSLEAKRTSPRPARKRRRLPGRDRGTRGRTVRDVHNRVSRGEWHPARVYSSKGCRNCS